MVERFFFEARFRLDASFAETVFKIFDRLAGEYSRYEEAEPEFDDDNEYGPCNTLLEETDGVLPWLLWSIPCSPSILASEVYAQFAKKVDALELRLSAGHEILAVLRGPDPRPRLETLGLEHDLAWDGDASWMADLRYPLPPWQYHHTPHLKLAEYVFYAAREAVLHGQAARLAERLVLDIADLEAFIVPLRAAAATARLAAVWSPARDSWISAVVVRNARSLPL